MEDGVVDDVSSFNRGENSRPDSFVDFLILFYTFRLQLDNVAGKYIDENNDRTAFYDPDELRTLIIWQTRLGSLGLMIKL